MSLDHHAGTARLTEPAGHPGARPYGDAANAYYTAGWRGVLPLPAAAKTPPPGGYTGAGGAWPSGADVWTWAEDHATGNIALRLPPNVIGLDVDAYDGKQGAATLDNAITKWGPLPATWRATSRSDPRSGIYLYRVPPGLAWPGELGPAVEIIQTRHRYAVAPPSLHPTGRPYRWHTPEGHITLDAADVPALNDLPELPQPWVDALTGGRLAVDIAKAAVDDTAHAAWLGQDKHVGAPCGIVRTTLARALDELNAPAGSRHDATLRVVMHLARLSTEGHTGCGIALDAVCTAFTDAVSPDRGVPAATAEWSRIYDGALAVIAADGQLAPCDLDDPCAHPLAGIITPADLHTAPRLDVISPYSAPRDTVDAQTQPLIDGDLDPFTIEVQREERRIEVRETARANVAARRETAAFGGMPDLRDLDAVAELDPPDIDWTIRDLLPAHGNVVVIAAAKAGKTTTVNDVVRSLADGDDVFDRYRVDFPTGTCALFNFEVGADMYHRWILDVGVRNGARVHVMNLRGLRLPLSAPTIRDMVVDRLTEAGTRVWVLDPFARALIGNALSENDNSEVSAFLDVLDEVKARAGVEHLIIPTHAARGDYAPGSERSRGASRLEDWADVRWYLNRDSEGGRFFRASGRDVETDEEQLIMDPLTRRLTLRPGERAEPPANGRKKRNATDAEIQAAVIQHITDAPGVGSNSLRQAVADRVACRRDRVDDAVRALSSQRLVITVEGRNRMREHYLPSQIGPR